MQANDRRPGFEDFSFEATGRAITTRIDLIFYSFLCKIRNFFEPKLALQVALKEIIWKGGGRMGYS